MDMDNKKDNRTYFLVFSKNFSNQMFIASNTLKMKDEITSFSFIPISTWTNANKQVFKLCRVGYSFLQCKTYLQNIKSSLMSGPDIYQIYRVDNNEETIVVNVYRPDHLPPNTMAIQLFYPTEAEMLKNVTTEDELLTSLKTILNIVGENNTNYYSRLSLTI